MLSAVAAKRPAIALGALAVLGGVACGALSWWGRNHSHVALVAVMTLLAPLPFVIRAVQRRWDPFEPINLMAIGIIMWFVARPIYELTNTVNPYPHYDASRGFDQAMMIGIVGTAALYSAYFSHLGARVARRVTPLPDVWDAARSLRFVRWMLLLGAFLTLGYVAQAGLHFVLSLYTGRAADQRSVQHVSSAYFEQGPYLAIPASFILLVAWYRRRSFGTAAALVFTVALALIITVPRGDRTFILELVLPLVVLWYLRHNRRPRLVMILLAVIAFGVVANVEVAWRNKELRAGHSVAGTVVSALEHPWRPLATQFVTGADPSEFTVLEIEAHAYAIGTLKHQPGATIRNILIGWIPHQILTKPLTPLQYVSWTLFPATINAGSYGPPMFGSMFADFGWPTLVLFSLFVGFGLRGVWEYFRERLHVGGMQLVFAGMLPLVIILLRDDIDDIFYRSVFLVLPLILCVRTYSRSPRRVRELFRRPERSAVSHAARSSGAMPSRSAAP